MGIRYALLAKDKWKIYDNWHTPILPQVIKIKPVKR